MEWIEPRLPDKKVIVVDEWHMSVACAVRGKPSPRVTWYKDGARLPTPTDYFRVEEEKTQIDQHSWNVTQVLRWEGEEMRSVLD